MANAEPTNIRTHIEYILNNKNIAVDCNYSYVDDDIDAGTIHSVLGDLGIIKSNVTSIRLSNGYMGDLRTHMLYMFDRYTIKDDILILPCIYALAKYHPDHCFNEVILKKYIPAINTNRVLVLFTLLDMAGIIKKTDNVNYLDYMAVDL